MSNESRGRRNYYSRSFAGFWVLFLVANGVEIAKSAGVWRWIFAFIEVGLALAAVDIIYSAVTRKPARRYRQRA